jgi:hypothetical protein
MPTFLGSSVASDKYYTDSWREESGRLDPALKKPMATTLALPTHLRLSTPEIWLLAKGLQVIFFYCSDLQVEKYDPGLLERIQQLDQTLRTRARDAQSATHRLHLDALSLAVCMFAVRSVERESRIGRFPSCVWPPGIDFARLLQKLEKHRKRAKRLWARVGDPETYQGWHQRWRRFLDWVREALRPDRVRLFDYPRWCLNKVCETAKRVLQEREEPLPPDSDLRKLVRKALRHARRGRGTASVRDMLEANVRAEFSLATFLVPRVRKILQCPRQPEDGFRNSFPTRLLPA